MGLQMGLQMGWGVGVWGWTGCHAGGMGAPQAAWQLGVALVEEILGGGGGLGVRRYMWGLGWLEGGV